MLPIFYRNATPWDHDQSVAIERILRGMNQYESEQEFSKRRQVIKQLNKVVRDWIFECGRKMGKDESECAKLGGKIFPFGSF